MRRVTLPILLLAIGFLLLAGPVMAGGAATVTLDALPTEVRAGEAIHLTFVVRQHGRNPVDEFPEVGPVEPYLSASNRETGERLRVEGYKEEGAEVGHFAVDVTFPSEGLWNWEIRPEPFEMMNQFEPLTVLPAASASTATSSATAVAGETTTLRTILRVAGIATVLVAVGLALLSRQRQRPRPAASLEPR